MPADVVVVEIVTDAQMKQAWAIRRAVFIEEQGVPEEIEMDSDDARAIHALALADNVAVGCGRMVADGDHVKIGRMAVLRDWRGKGIGRRVLDFLTTSAQRAGCVEAVLHAQLTAEGFYLKNSYEPVGDVFEEAGIMHRMMRRAL